MSQISCKNLSSGYEGRTIIDNLSFDVNSGDYLMILGENGSGKSTLVRTIIGLQKPFAGQVLLDAGLSLSDIGYLPQQSAVQKDFPASVREVVISGFVGRMGHHVFFNRSYKHQAQHYIELMGLKGLENRSYQMLSGGQQQRVHFARALCAAHKVIVLDEPVTGLDPDAAAAMYQCVQELNRRGMTIIMISHDVSAVQKYASHVLLLGRPIFYGTQEEFLRVGTDAEVCVDCNI